MVSAATSQTIMMMSGKPSVNIERTLGNENDILVVEECESETTDNSKRLSIIENIIHRVLHLDDQNRVCEDEENRQTQSPSIENGTGTKRKNEKRSSEGQKFPCESAHDILPRHPSTWPQRPLMIRPTPHSCTKIIGVVSYKFFRVFSLWFDVARIFFRL